MSKVINFGFDLSSMPPCFSNSGVLCSSLVIMVGWNASRHQAWNMMFTAGLTAREIADRCKQNIATVYLHLKKGEKYDTDFFAQHATELEARKVPS